MRQSFIMIIILVLLYTSEASGSDGDRSPFYQKCVKSCVNDNCTQDGSFTTDASEKLDLWCWMLQWSCLDECRYHCMWQTVQGFQVRGYDVPKFHGKWPFKRLMGVQEPASAFASLLNLVIHVYMHSKLYHFSLKNTPLVLFWHIFFIICVNAWIWSVLFHIRDNPFTEFMDYSSALLMVIASFIAALVRLFHKRRKFTAMLLLLPLLYYIEHVRYLYTGRIDYEYNMIVNMCFGMAGSVLWVLWSCFQYLAGRRYVWRIMAFTIISGVTLLLELFDFPPKHEWDAHALWHLSTAPPIFLFYKFVIDDLNYLKNSRDKSDLKLT